MILWQAAAKTIPDRLWLGHGLDTQPDVLVKAYRPDWALAIGPDAVVYRAHNVILDTLLSQGLAGLLFWTFIMIWLARKFWPRAGDRERAARIIIICGFSALFVFLQFQYWHLTLLAYALFLLAVLSALDGQKDESRQTAFPLPEPAESGIISRAGKTALWAGAAGVLVLAYYQAGAVLAQVRADHYFWEFRNADYRNAVFAAADMQSFLRAEMPDYGRYDQALASMWAGRVAELPHRNFYPPEIMDNSALPWTKVRTYSRLKYLADYLILEEFFRNRDNEDRIMPVLAELASINPSRLEPHLISARYRILRSECDSALLALAQARQNLIPPDDPRLNPRYSALLRTKIEYIERLENACEGEAQTGTPGP